MGRRTCIALSSIHLLALAISTYVASMEIESIIVTGVVCSITGIAAGVAAIKLSRPWLAAAALMVPVITVVLFIIEAFFLHLGPLRAALPFCIVFMINQVFSTLTILVQLNILVAKNDAPRLQITIKTLMVSIVAFSVFFGIARQLLVLEHDWIAYVSLGLLGLTLVGLGTTLYSAHAASSGSSLAG